MSTHKIKAVLFDFGGVFTESPFLSIEAAGAEMGARPGQLADIMFGPYHIDSDHPWHRLERAEISLDQANKEIIELGAQMGFDIEPLELLSRIGTGKGTREPLVDKVRQLKTEGYLTGIITNNALEFREFWWPLIPVDELFDLVIDSSEVGIRKPDPAIYHLTLSKLGNISPDQSVFLDDLPANVEAAIQLGIHGILVGDDPHAAVNELNLILEGS